MKTALIFGSTGGIGAAVVSQFANSHRVVTVSRHQLDFTQADNQCPSHLDGIIAAADPDVIVNCAGLFAGTFQDIFAVNVASNWHILQYYMEKYTVSKPVTILLVGSSAYRGGRRRYPVYSASKAALHNLVQGCQEALADSAVTVSLLHPARVATRMSESLPGNQQLTPHRWLVNW